MSIDPMHSSTVTSANHFFESRDNKLYEIYNKRKFSYLDYNGFLELHTGGFLFSEEQLMEIDKDQAKQLFKYSSNFLKLKNEYPEISLNILLSLPFCVLYAIGHYSEHVHLFIQAGFTFPWKQLTKFEPEAIRDIIINSPELIQVKTFFPELSLEKLMTFNSINFYLNNVIVTGFSKIKKAGIEYTLDQFINLENNRKKIIADVCDELIFCKQAGIEVSWDQIISLDLYTQGRLKIHAKQLKKFKEAGIEPTWDDLIGTRTITIPPSKRKKTNN